MVDAPRRKTDKKGERQTGPGSSLPQHAILVVERNASVRRSVAKALSRAGCDVSTAANASQAKEFLQQYEFSTIVLDLPRADAASYERLRLLIGCGGKARVIVVSAYEGRRVRETLWELGASALLVKPIRRAELLGAVLTTDRTDPGTYP